MFTIQLSKHCLAFIAALLLSKASPFEDTDQPPPPRTERQLIEILQTKPKPEKAIACKQLATVGTKECVPELAKLLSDKELASWSRIAIEAIPDPAASEALVEAAKHLHGRLLIGTINSIGVRKIQNATGVLSGLLTDKDKVVASAAAISLGKIGNDAATKSLRDSLSNANSPVLNSVAEGCILCAERLAADGKSDEAAKLYDVVRKADVPKQRKLEATRGSILARKSAGIPLLVEQLHSNDRAFFFVGLTAARQLPGREVTDALATELSRIEPQQAVPLLSVFADRNDGPLPRAVLEAAKSGDKQVRIAAIGVVGRRGDASNLPVLLEDAGGSDEPVAQAAAAALAMIPGENVDAELVASLSKTNGKALAALIQAIGARRIDATRELMKALDNSDTTVRQAALAALGETIKFKDLSVMISAYVDGKNSNDAEVIGQALRAACVRMPDREGCAAKLATAIPQASTDKNANIIGILAAMGGPKALETIGAAAKGKDETLQDTATKSLGKWMTVDAAPVLLDLANPQSGCKYPDRALRGYIRLARQFTMPDDERAQICENALKAARRNEDRKLVLEALERHPSKHGLEVAVKTAQFTGMKDDTRKASLVIAQHVGGDRADVRQLLAKIGVKPVKLEIIKAQYGAGTTQRDVTEALQKDVRDFPVINLKAGSYNKSFGGDPAPGSPKTLVVHYRIDGKNGEATFAENAVIMLPVPE